MRKPTEPTDNKLIIRSEKSGDPVYKEDRWDVIQKFQKKYPRYQGLSVLKMRAVLAGDVTIVHQGRSKFVLWFTDELEILDEINREIRKQNRVIRARKKAQRDRINNLISEYGIVGAIEKCIENDLGNYQGE